MARSLMPKEHGAYGQLAFPSISALCLGEPTVPSFALVVAACAAFFAHEPWLVLLGRRGSRARREDGRRAAVALAASLALAAASAAVALWLAPRVAWALAPSAALAVLVIPLVLAEREKSLVGELLVATALSALALPVALTAGVSLPWAIVLCCVWSVGFGLATAGVREVMRRAREPERAGAAAMVVLGMVGVALVASALRGWWAPLAVAPFLLATTWLVVAPPSPRHMKRVGWSLIGASTLTLAAVVALGRAPSP